MASEEVNGKPPPYDFDSPKKTSHDFAQWAEEQVADAVGKLGPSKAWERYSALCIEKELDGPTMMAISVDDLVNDYKFSKPHAKVVVEYFQPRTSPQPPNLGLTENEMKIVAPLVDKVETCRASCDKFEKMLASLETQKDEKLTEVKEWVENAHSVLNQSHSCLTEEIKTN